MKKPTVVKPPKSLLDTIRTFLNKLTDKTYSTMSGNIIEAIRESPAEDVEKISAMVFDLASTNRFYSKIYADLYKELMKLDAGVWTNALETQIVGFVALFDVIETADPKVDYDRFCELNKKSERRKALVSFFVNLDIDPVRLDEITSLLLDKVFAWIDEKGKKNEVDEVTEIIALLRPASSGLRERIRLLSKMDVKEHPSLTKKSVFKYEDLSRI